MDKDPLQRRIYFLTFVESLEMISFFFFRSGLRGPKAYSLWGGVVTSLSIGQGNL